MNMNYIYRNQRIQIRTLSHHISWLSSKLIFPRRLRQEAASEISSVHHFYSTAVKNYNMSGIRHLNQQEAINLDQELFNSYKFSVDQLMELVGLACSQVIAEAYPDKEKKILVCIGPGNNGGDGLVCSRHLKQIGYQPHIIYPKKVDKILYKNLLNQCEMHDIPIVDEVPTQDQISQYSVIIDGIFGFSFKPPVRPLFVPLLQALAKTNVPIVSIDIPSGWDVENGPNAMDEETTFHPDALISCSAPKLCAKHFKGKFHYLVGNFIPVRMQNKYQLNFPPMGTSQIYLLPQSN